MTAGTERLPWLVEPLPEPKIRRGRPAIGYLLVGALAVAALTATALLLLWLPTTPDEPPVTASTIFLPPAAPQAVEPTSDTLLPVTEETVTPSEALPTAPPPRVDPVRPVGQPRPDAGAAASATATEGTATADEEKVEPTPTRAVFPADEAPPSAPPVTGPRPIVIYHPQPMRGRVVQLGAFASREAANRVWRGVVWSYPYLAGKPRSVAPVDVRDPRTGRSTRMYRLQLATSSQAQSAVICQQLARARRNCTVVY